MPHDKNGAELKVGDKVTVTCEITAIQTGTEYCNLSVKTVEPMHPGKDHTSISLNTKQVEKCECDDAVSDPNEEPSGQTHSDS